MKESKAMKEIRKIRKKDDKIKRKMTAEELYSYMVEEAKETHKELNTKHQYDTDFINNPMVIVESKAEYKG